MVEGQFPQYHIKEVRIMERYQPKKLSIGDTARLCGVTIKQIRHWEAKGYIPKATRVVCGERAYRLFSPDDMQLIQKIKDYLDEGFTLQAAAEKIKKGGGQNA